ncbi:MAG: hypothetical protein C4541_02520 [Candidatus Auribacter fodinae]|jgi:flagellar motility protein MotE (MotC chaperone)|uniref:Magnesium transporter MgtE intracellular domain-containing protein n=1 Tax=Candidatus Auribacter fodinae TaxID=2093366 RepID=A0A3A4R4W9_9BACT|nr:MAG: hypothetical protein C4541_02520 [Candidatus Auribacter fodinae]
MSVHNKSSVQGNAVLVLLMGMCAILLTALMVVGFLYYKKQSVTQQSTGGESQLYLDYSSLLEEMKEKRKLLTEKETILEEQDKRIKKLEAELQSARQNLEVFQKEVSKNLKVVESQEQKNLRKLAKMYGLMEADKAAPIIAGLDDDTVVQILMMMKERQAANLLATFSAINGENKKRAALLSARMRTLTFAPPETEEN